MLCIMVLMFLGYPISLYYNFLCAETVYGHEDLGKLEVLNNFNYRIRDTLQFTNNDIYMEGMQTPQDKVNFISKSLN